ncbi:AraC family transcriptional regulator [Pseudoalteromonas sp. HM-SA03]|uniref:GlxA family transcriptional regulator n=1 Tax=unclassified Pseudoalteromonas TaxID=194690 RepID=UPI000BAE5893|nr:MULTISPECIES: helix-turn-helix domain-containing protein [unclassified Pseudoalteromonas]NSY34327.1 helix-turn-helix domain-containing protein [Pseudoalteromonas sp. JC28]PAX99893.1 AraC family transcriptional regulator [Pseudoalteromonas sp. HM-SA03]
MKVILLCPEHVFASALTGVIDILNVANKVAGKAVFCWQTVALSGQKSVMSSQGLEFVCHAEFSALADADVVIWLGSHFSSEPLLWQQCQQVKAQLNKHGIEFHPATYQLAGCCGTAFLATAGLLDQKQFTCSWWLTPFFTRYFPVLKPNSQKVTEQSGMVYTAGAAHSYLHLMLRFITDVLGSEVAKTIAAWLAIPNEQASQNEFVQLSGFLQHRDAQLLKAQYHISDNLDVSHSLQSLAKHACMSERTLIRRFKQHTSMTPFEYVRLARLVRTKQLLHSTNMSVEQIANQVGYQDSQALAKQYKKHYNQSLNRVRGS